MTDKEKAIVMAHTGICMLTEDKFQIFHKYVENLMGRPVMTHEIGFLAGVLKEKSKDDFIALCVDESGSEKPNNSENPTGSTTKNDLGVDCVSRQEVLRLLANSIGKTNTYLQTEVLKMPSVTPQKTKTKKVNLIESACHHVNNSREESLLYRDRNIVREQPTADVVERKKIDKAIEEIMDIDWYEIIRNYDDVEMGYKSEVEKILKEI